MDHHAGSAPPPSPIPPPPVSERPLAGAPWRSGWRPADDDHGPLATAWRADTALRVARRNEAQLEGLGDRLDDLGARFDRFATSIDAWSVTWGERWATAGRILRWAGAIVGALAVAGAAREAWAWVSTLHH